MYRIEIPGCLTTLLILLILYFLVKELWWLFVGIAIIVIVSYYANQIYRVIKEKKQQEAQNYTPEMGEVFKVCPYCNAKVKVTATTCPCCNRALN